MFRHAAWLLTLLLAGSAALAAPGVAGAHAAHTEQSPKIELRVNQSTAHVGGLEVTLDSPPVIQDGRTLVPLRFIGEALGAGIGYDSTDRKVTYTKGSLRLELWIGRTTAVVNGRELALDVAPGIVAARTMVPVRFVSENLGAGIAWDGQTKTVTVTVPPGEAPIASGKVVIRMKGNHFMPMDGAIKKGTTVTWVNMDPEVHNSVELSSKWVNQRIEPGQSWSVTLTEPGHYKYTCAFHVPMDGFLTVVP